MLSRGLLLGFLLSVVIVTDTLAVESPIINPLKCNNHRPLPVNATGSIQQTVKLWQGIVLLLCLGAFALFVCLIHRVVRTYIYYDAHLLDTYYDGGGDTNATLIAASIITRYVLPSTFSQPITDMKEFGVVGHFWYAAGLAVPLFLFCIVAAEIRIKAPGAKTFLQVIHARFGTCTHVIMMTFALICNLMIVGMVMLEGTRVMVAITNGLTNEVAAIVIALTVGFYTVVGGVGGTIYVSYFITALYFSIMMVFFTDVFWDPLRIHSESNEIFGSIGEIFVKVECGMVSPRVGNEQNSPLTFLSRGGMIEGVLLTISGFSSVFVNQAFWQAGMAAKPGHAVWGFISGGITWFALPFALSLALGITYWVLSVHAGVHIASQEVVRHGLVPMYISQTLMGTTGTFMMLTITMGSIMTASSSQVLSVSSIIMYDIYQTYISPFKAGPVPEDKQMSVRMQRAIRNEEYLEYDRRCVWLKHIVVISVTILLIPIALVLVSLNIDVYWLFMLTGIVCGGSVLPVAFAVTWHRTTAGGVSAGAIGGFCVGVITWLVLSSIQPGGLMQFRDNTTQWLPLVVGLTSALVLGGVLCILVSVTCGGCDKDLLEEEEWEKTRQIDNPILPWSVKYAPDIGADNLSKGRPHFFTVRRTFKGSEICAYIFGVLLAVCAVLVWPASMLTANIFSQTFFTAWVYVVLIWAILATAFIIFLPFFWEIAQNCRQAYYNRMWAHSDHHGRLHEEPSDVHPDTGYRNPDTGLRNQDNGYRMSAQPAPVVPEVPEVVEPDFHSQIDDGINKERWKTFIHLE